MRKKLFLFAVLMVIGSYVRADLASDIALLFTTIESSVENSKYHEANQIMRRWKIFPDQLRIMLSSVKVVDGVANTTPLHVAASASRDNHGISVLIFQKASVMPNYQAFASELANACDALGRKPIDVADHPDIINFLSRFTVPSIVCPSNKT